MDLDFDLDLLQLAPRAARDENAMMTASGSTTAFHPHHRGAAAFGELGSTKMPLAPLTSLTNRNDTAWSVSGGGLGGNGALKQQQMAQERQSHAAAPLPPNAMAFMWGSAPEFPTAVAPEGATTAISNGTASSAAPTPVWHSSLQSLHWHSSGDIAPQGQQQQLDDSPSRFAEATPSALRPTPVAPDSPEVAVRALLGKLLDDTPARPEMAPPKPPTFAATMAAMAASPPASGPMAVGAFTITSTAAPSLNHSHLYSLSTSQSAPQQQQAPLGARNSSLSSSQERQGSERRVAGAAAQRGHTAAVELEAAGGIEAVARREGAGVRSGHPTAMTHCGMMQQQQQQSHYSASRRDGALRLGAQVNVQNGRRCPRGFAGLAAPSATAVIGGSPMAASNGVTAFGALHPRASSPWNDSDDTGALSQGSAAAPSYESSPRDTPAPLPPAPVPAASTTVGGWTVSAGPRSDATSQRSVSPLESEIASPSGVSSPTSAAMMLAHAHQVGNSAHVWVVVEFKQERRMRFKCAAAVAGQQPPQVGQYVVVEYELGNGVDCGLCVGVFTPKQRHLIPRDWDCGCVVGQVLRLATPSDCIKINEEMPDLEARALERAHNMVHFLHLPFDVIDAEFQFDLTVVRIFYSLAPREHTTAAPNMSRLQRELGFFLKAKVVLEQMVVLPPVSDAAQ
jgi:hypothetical protein